ncbi:unnamed protein product, partial [Soboliphyme baturini]|uniref:PBPe domain-containing protein n=1 Tax=Soboliphyme baturini TaxID=241478 RepID=A0A183J2U4_9BILA
DKVSVIIYIAHWEAYGKSTASAQYLIHLASHTGIPIIAWNADNSGLTINGNLNKYRLLQMAPSIDYQIAAMVKILQRYNWHKFAVVTSEIAGKDSYIELFIEVQINTKNITSLRRQMDRLAKSEARIFLLYSTNDEADQIFRMANALGLTGKQYLWIVTQSVVSNLWKVLNFSRPIWLLLRTVITTGITHGQLVTYCTSISKLSALYGKNNLMFRYLKTVKTSGETGIQDFPKLDIEFDEDGNAKNSYLSILNLKPDRHWEKVGEFFGDQLKMNDITWPGNETSPPPGVRQKFHLKIVTLDEPPFIFVHDVDPVNDRCLVNQGVLCRWGTHGYEVNTTRWKCCSGFCMDLLNKLAADIGFDYDLYKVEDGRWGIKENHKWNGLVAELVNKKADMSVTALKINSEREKVIDFSVPFLETGIAIVVAIRRGALSPAAFLEPFESTTWIFILIVSIQGAAVSIFLFEWLSPRSFNMTKTPPPGHKFSLCRSYWLVWATMFSASVTTSVPRSNSSRFMSLIWAAFALLFLAVYTANLAAFMVTGTEFHHLSGIEDPKIINPQDYNPSFRYGTIRSGNTEETLRKNYGNVYRYIKYNDYFYDNVSHGVSAVKKNDLQALLYDAVVLDYLAGKDDNCEILVVGKWFSLSGYSIGFPKGSKWMTKVNSFILKYSEQGKLD